MCKAADREATHPSSPTNGRLADRSGLKIGIGNSCSADVQCGLRNGRRRVASVGRAAIIPLLQTLPTDLCCSGGRTRQERVSKRTNGFRSLIHTCALEQQFCSRGCHERNEGDNTSRPLARCIALREQLTSIYIKVNAQLMSPLPASEHIHQFFTPPHRTGPQCSSRLAWKRHEQTDGLEETELEAPRRLRRRSADDRKRSSKSH